MNPEPFESSDPSTPHRKCASALAQSILKSNPHLASRNDHELVAAHHRATYLREFIKLNDWRDSQTAGKSRDLVYGNRLEILRATTLRHARNDLVQLQMPIEQAQEIADAILGDKATYEAAFTTLNNAICA